MVYLLKPYVFFTMDLGSEYRIELLIIQIIVTIDDAGMRRLAVFNTVQGSQRRSSKDTDVDSY